MHVAWKPVFSKTPEMVDLLVLLGLAVIKTVFATNPWINVKMPSKSFYSGFPPPKNITKWQEAIVMATQGRNVLLEKAMQTIKSPFDLVTKDRKFRWIQRMSDLHITWKKKEEIQTVTADNFPMIPIVQFGHNSFEYEGLLSINTHFQTNHSYFKNYSWRSWRPNHIPRRLQSGTSSANESIWKSKYFNAHSGVGLHGRKLGLFQHKYSQQVSNFFKPSSVSTLKSTNLKINKLNIHQNSAMGPWFRISCLRNSFWEIFQR